MGALVLAGAEAFRVFLSSDGAAPSVSIIVRFAGTALPLWRVVRVELLARLAVVASGLAALRLRLGRGTVSSVVSSALRFLWLPCSRVEMRLCLRGL